MDAKEEDSIPKEEDSIPDSIPTTSRTSIPPRNPLFALVFSGQAFDSIMELGVIHALVESERKAPDYVLGISAGSITAVAMGEIQTLPNKQAKVARFREFLNAYLGAPSNFIMAMLPQPSDADWQAPLEPMQLPIHNEEERADREKASRYLSGTMAFLNDFASLHITTRVISRVSYRALNLSAVENRVTRFKRLYGHLRHMVPLIGIAVFNLWRLSPVAWKLTVAIMWQAEVTRRPKPVASFLGVMPRLWNKVWRAVVTASGLLLLYVGAIPVALICYGIYLFWRIVKVLFLEIQAVLVKATLTTITHGLKLWESALLRQIATWLRYLHSNNDHASLLCKDGIPLRGYGDYLHKLLKQYDIGDQILNSYPIKQFVVQLFDPNYYGSRNMNDIWERSLLQQDQASSDLPSEGPASKTSKTLEAYQATRCKIAIGATCVATGRTFILSERIPVVDTIQAAMAYPPFFKAEKVRIYKENDKQKDRPRALVIDASSVGEEPTLLTIKFIKEHLKKLRPLDEQSFICVYPVTTYPAAKPSRQESYNGLVDRVQRARDLQRVRRSTMEHQSVRNHTRLLPASKGVHIIKHGQKRSIFVGADVFPIEADEPLRLTTKLITSPDRSEQERIVLHGVATGCRATLQRLFAIEIHNIAGSRHSIGCKELFKKRLSIQPPESTKGGGLSEVCEHCSVTISDVCFAQALTVPESTNMDNPAWPKEGLPPKPYHGKVSSPFPTPGTSLDRNTKDKPWVSLLLSGGVFRGVFQIGVLSGLNEAGVKPRLIAGSSVGAIIAAMAARMSGLQNSAESRKHLCCTAATFLGLDRLILTDRFADFTRRFVIRAEKADLSLKDIDDILRRFDTQSHAEFDNKARRILGGIERLLAISPFELVSLVKEFRNGNDQSAWKLVKEYINYFLDRNEVGLEVLGTEPLRFLIQEHVLAGIGLATNFSHFLNQANNPTCLLATTTDLYNGKLKVIGASNDSTPDEALLVEALLASSAFPGVFRSRRSSEVFPQTSDNTEYVDGGLMDNLPIEAVVTFLKDASRKGKVDCRPSTPHLLLIAPLEPDYLKLNQYKKKEDKVELDRLEGNWILLSKRVAQLRYNRKITMFMEVEENFRVITEKSGLWDAKEHWNPLKLKVQPITPKWLCGTFGFHAMLGFRHDRQAANIAHGCAKTLITLAHIESKTMSETWNISVQLREGLIEENPKTKVRTLNEESLDRLRKSNDSPAQSGACWFRQSGTCPFSRQSLEEMGGITEFQSHTKTMLNLIYLQCGMPKTHHS